MKMASRNSVSSQFVDLIKRPLSVSSDIVASLSDKNQPCKAIAARVMAATAVLRAVQPNGSGNQALETILERTEGKVPNPDAGSAGVSIAFNFMLAPGGPMPSGSVGEVLQGVLASQALQPVNPLPAAEPLRIVRATDAREYDDGASD